MRLRLFCVLGGSFLCIGLLMGAAAPSSRPALRAEVAKATSQPSKPKKKKATGYPTNDIFLASVSWQGSKLQVGKVTRVTQRKQYDNQPAFLPSGRQLLYSSLQEGGQTDIMLYTISSKKHLRLTRTKESEFSPTPTPDGVGFSSVLIEQDKTQRLWLYPLIPGPDGMIQKADVARRKVLLPALKPVGYHAWAGATTLAFFVLGTPHTLQVVDLVRQQPLAIAGNIGRAVFKIPGQDAFGFTHKLPKQPVWIKRLNPHTYTTRFVCKALKGSEDLAWAPGKDVIIMARGSKLYQHKVGTNPGWRLVADLKKQGLKGITRLAFDKRATQLAIVGVH